MEITSGGACQVIDKKRVMSCHEFTDARRHRPPVPDMLKTSIASTRVPWKRLRISALHDRQGERRPVFLTVSDGRVSRREKSAGRLAERFAP